MSAALNRIAELMMIGSIIAIYFLDILTPFEYLVVVLLLMITLSTLKIVGILTRFRKAD